MARLDLVKWWSKPSKTRSVAPRRVGERAGLGDVAELVRSPRKMAARAVERERLVAELEEAGARRDHEDAVDPGRDARRAHGHPRAEGVAADRDAARRERAARRCAMTASASSSSPRPVVEPSPALADTAEVEARPRDGVARRDRTASWRSTAARGCACCRRTAGAGWQMRTARRGAAGTCTRASSVPDRRLDSPPATFTAGERTGSGTGGGRRSMRAHAPPQRCLHPLGQHPRRVRHGHELGLLRIGLRARLELDVAAGEPLGADGHAQRDADEVRVLELHAGALVAVVPEDLDAAPPRARRAARAPRSSTVDVVADGHEVHLVRRDGSSASGCRCRRGAARWSSRRGARRRCRSSP